MTSTSIEPSSSSSIAAPPPELPRVFEDLVLLQPHAQKILKTNTQGEKISLPKTKVLTEQLREVNSKFNETWQKSHSMIRLSDGKVKKIATPDYAAVISFLKENGILGLLSDVSFFEARCQTNFSMHVSTLHVWKQKEGCDIYSTKALQQLSELKELGLSGVAADPKEIVKLPRVSHLTFGSYDTSEIDVLASLKLRSLFWTHFSSVNLEQREKPIDIAPFAAIKSLVCLQIQGEKVSAQDKPCISLTDLNPLTSIPGLETFSVCYATVSQDTTLTRKSNLTQLRLSGCVLKDLSFMQNMENLGILEISECDLSCQSIVYPPQVFWVKIIDSTVKNLDKLLSPLLDQSSLKLLTISRKNNEPFSEEENNIIRQLKAKGVNVASPKKLD